MTAVILEEQSFDVGKDYIEIESVDLNQNWQR
jgi:hypothetical protein